MASKADPRRILVDNYFDSVRAEFVQGDHVITINNGLILDILEASGLPDSERSPEGPDVIDLRGLTVLPGFVDTHVHLFLHPYVETPWIDQVTRESMPERTIRAVKHARNTLLSGFTTVRDLGTEGACEADIALRKCISSPVSLIPGPRYFCVTRGIVTTGSYEPKGELYPSQQGVDGVTGAQAADGPDQCMKTVRQQVGAGADWIKVYGDYSARARVSQTSPAVGPRSIPLWTKPEWESLVNTSHSLGVKVAVHAETTEAALAALGAGADSIEHGSGFNHTVFEKLREARTIWNPTLAVYYSMDPNGSEWAQCKQNFQNVLRENEQVSYEQSLSVRIATGGDTGVFPHGNNALELQLMHSLGMPARRVLQAATLVGWECVRGMEWDGESGRVRLEAHQRQPETLGDNETPFGCLERGFAADIIATAGDLIGGDEEGFRDAVSAEKVVFVMKSGRVYKLGGKSLV